MPPLQQPSSIPSRTQVLVIGGGPSGASCAYWLADAGYEVVVVEKKAYPREKTCGDGLTPRSVHQLYEMGLEAELAKGAHPYQGLRAHTRVRSLELAWPSHPQLPSQGYVITRADLDFLVAQRAESAGATIFQKTEALSPLVENGVVTGAVVRSKAEGSSGAPSEIRAEYVVIADGANSRLGRALGTSRRRSYPLGMAIRGYWNSPMHNEPWIDVWMDMSDASGAVMPGYGWLFPLGDGRVNVGVGLMSTANKWKGVNTTELMEAFVTNAPEEWELTPENCLGPATGGRLPMGLSVGPKIGPSHLVIGDASGSINPFNGEGIAYAYETGRMAAAAISMALATSDGRALSTYIDSLRDTFGLYYRVGRAFSHIIARPELMQFCVNTGMRNRTLMEWVMRIMANILRPDETGPAEAAYKIVANAARLGPGSLV